MLHIIIVIYHHETYKDVARSITRADISESTLHIADNSNSKAVLEYFKSYDEVKYYGIENVGYGRAINYVLQQIKLVEDDLVLICNDDLQFDSQVIHKLTSGYFTLKLKYKLLGPIAPWFVRKTGEEESALYQNVREINKDVVQVDFSPAAMWLMDYQLLKTVGGFLPEFFMYAEDKEYLFRTKSLGFECFALKNVLVQHNFDYPPKSIKLRVEKIKNTYVAFYLNRNPQGVIPHVHVVKAVLVSLSKFQFLRLFCYLNGYAKFVFGLGKYRAIKLKQKHNVDFRYLG